MIFWREEYEKLLEMIVRANAMAENYYADGKGSGHPSIRKFHKARDEFFDWRRANAPELITDDTKTG